MTSDNLTLTMIEFHLMLLKATV